MYEPEWLPQTSIWDFLLLSKGRRDGNATELKGRWVGWSKVSWGSISLFLLIQVVRERTEHGVMVGMVVITGQEIEIELWQFKILKGDVSCDLDWIGK